MLDLRLSFRISGRDEEIMNLLNLAHDLGYLSEVNVEIKDRIVRTISEYNITLSNKYADDILKRGFKNVLADDEQVQAAMNLTETEIIDLVEQIDW